MIKTVIKRDGSKQVFEYDKILKAISKAFKACNLEEFPNRYVKNRISKYLINLHEECSVEEIQNAVENCLMKEFPNEVAKAYILWREKHRESRFIKGRIDYMNKYANSSDNAASASETDANSNVTIKNVANLEGEVYKSNNRVIQRQRMKDKLNELYPEVAKQYAEDLEHHIIYTHDEASTPVLKNYCMAVSLYPLMQYGTSTMDGLRASAPNNLDSFCGQFVNLVFLLSSQCKGAVGFGEFFNFFDYYCAKEWGENYHTKEDVIVDTEHALNRKTISQKIEQYFQQVVYSMNQCAGNRSYQSPFTNFNYFDSYYWHSLFDDFAFPDGSKPVWERVSYLQKKFMKWFNKERTKTLLTYPVESMCILHNGKEPLDKEYADFASEMWSEGHSFFMYLSDNPDAVASCCRLRNAVGTNTFSSTNGLTGVQTGSCNVITLNINRIVQDFVRLTDGEPYAYKSMQEYIIKILERVYKYHIAYKTMLYEQEEKGMFTASNAGYISMQKLFSTFGVNGINEAAMFLGLEVSNNKEYKDFVILVLSTIMDFCNQHSTKKFMLNLEIVPKRSGHFKPLLIDSKLLNKGQRGASNSNNAMCSLRD